MQHSLEADGIVLSFNNRTILSDIYLKCTTGQILGVLGRNGCGKSSLLKIIFGSLTIENCSVRIDGKYTRKLFKEKEAVKYLPQHSFLPKKAFVKDIISLFVRQKVLQQQIAEFPEITKVYASRVGKLSGGIIRFLESVILLYSDAHFILMDEPFSHLSPVLSESLIEKIKEQSAYKGIVITDHIYRYILDVSTELLLLQNQKTYRIQHEQQLKDMGYLA